MNKRILSILLSALVCVTLTAQVSVSVKTPSGVVAGNKFTLTISVKNGESDNIKAPALNGCDFVYGPAVSNMHSYSYVNGKSTSTSINEYSFTYRANKAGSVTVPSVSVNVNGKTYSTKPTSFNVLPPDSKSNNRNDVHFDDMSSQSADKPISGNDIFVRIIMSKNSCYEQEPIVCTIKLFTKYSISSFMPTQQPAFDGFLSEELEVPQGSIQEHYNGQNYYTAVLKRCLLYPQKSGRLTISSGKYDLTVEQMEQYREGPFISVRPIQKQIKINSNNGVLNVMPLPQPAPDGFNGAVGHFSIESNLSNDVLRTNETSSLVITIKGNGNIKYLKEPKVTFPESFDLYTPKTDVDVAIVGDGFSGTMRYEYTFSPQQIGKFEIPETSFVYFDPDTRQYVTLKTKPIEAKVARGSSAAKSDVKVKNDDILHIKTGDYSVSSTRTFIIDSAFYWLCFVILTLGLITALIMARKSASRNADVARMKMTRANKVARKRLKLARSFMESHKYDQFYEELLRAMWGYLSDKLTMPLSDLTRDNISSKLTEFGSDDELVKNVIYVLDECEMSRYTPSNSDSKVGNLYDKAASSINGMESIKRK